MRNVIEIVINKVWWSTSLCSTIFLFGIYIVYGIILIT